MATAEPDRIFLDRNEELEAHAQQLAECAPDLTDEQLTELRRSIRTHIRQTESLPVREGA